MDKLLLIILITITPTFSFAEVDNKEITGFNYYEPTESFSESKFDESLLFDGEELEEKKKLAIKNNDPVLQHTIAYMYQNGLGGVSLSYKDALVWYSKAVKNDYLPSMVAMGKLYKLGGEDSDIRRNVGEARSLFFRAARLGNAQASYEIGVLYETGDGVFQNDKKAFAAYKVAAEGGVLNAYIKLGLFYQHGRGTRVSISEAIRNFNFVNSQTENPNLKEQINKLLGGVYVDIALSKTDPIESFKWHGLAAEYGIASSIIIIANAYRDGTNVKQDFIKAIDLYKKAIQLSEGHEEYKKTSISAKENLGYIYFNGLGVDRDYMIALKWYMSAAHDGGKEAAWNVGNYYFYGYGVDKDLREANRWFAKAR